MNEDGGGEAVTTRRVDQQKVALYKLFSFADRRDVVLMSVGTVSGMANGCSRPLMAVMVGKTVNAFGSTHHSHIVHQLSQICLAFLYLAVASGIAGFLQTSCWMVAGARQANRIRGLYLNTILRQDIAFFDTETTTGEVIGRMSGDTILIQDAMGEKAGKFIQLVSNFIGAFAFAFGIGWRLTLVLLPIVPLIIISGAAMAVVLTKLSTHGQVAYEEAGNIVEQTIGAIRTVASFTGEKHAMEKYDKRLKVAYAATVKQGIASGFGVGVALLMVFFSYALAIWYGSKLIIHKGFDGGKIVNVLFCVIGGGMSLGQASPCLSAFGAGQAAAYKMFETIKRKPKIDAYDSSGIVLEEIKGEIELKDVFFKYPARPEVQIFSGFSLHIPSGTTAALVGQSGSGKSTVISLLERFYDPQSGEVLIDGVDLKKLNLRCVREKIGLVSQEPILFTGSIKDNISYGKENATDEDIRTSIKLANAAKFIDKMPMGLDTMVGENGTQLSGGQKQRIAIARAILKNPKILLLDEATSALDAESERVVQDALQNIMVNRTTVVVAHRLTTIRNANNIAVVHQGKIVEQGTHMELIRDPDGAYSQLLRLQEGQHSQVEDPQLRASKSTRDRDNARRRSRSHSLSSQLSIISRDSSIHLSYSLSSGIPDPTGIIEMEFGGNEANTPQGEGRNNDDSRRRRRRSRVSLLRLAHLNKPEVPILMLGCVAAGFHGVIFPIFGLLIATAVKIFYEPPHELKEDSRFWAGMFVVLGVMTFIAVPLQNYLFGIAGGKLIQRICSSSFKKVVHQEISWFDDPANSSGSVGARLSTDASTVRSLVGDTLAVIVQNLVTVAAGLIISFTANWILALIILAILPLVGFQGYLQSKFLQGFSADAKVMFEEASQVANDAVSSIRTIASFCAEKKVMEMYQQKCEGPTRHGVRLGIVSGAGYGFSFFATYCTNAFCFYIGAVLVQNGKTTFAEVFKVFFALTLTALSISETSAMAPDANKAKDSAASIFELLDSKPKIDSSCDEGATLSTVKGDIELQNVSFKYSTRPDVQIFRDLSLSIPAGKTVALVGESGSGKSTVISLLERFYNPDSGLILLDGIQIQNFKLSWLRKQMGLVNQEPALFNESIRANISYGKQGEATEEEIISAARAANAHNFISALPGGYGTAVGERGLQLSGGQKQRIAIARAILKDPRILLLDEATNALDAESERVVQDALDGVMVDRTTVVVAHRLATIKGADVIAVVKNGAIAEKGTHDELMNIRNGAYASLVALHMATST